MFRSLKSRLLAAYLSVGLIVTGLALVGTFITGQIAESYQEAVSEKAPQLEALANAAMTTSQIIEDGLVLAYTVRYNNNNNEQDFIEKESEELAEAFAAADGWIGKYRDVAEEEEEVELADELNDHMLEINASIDHLVQIARGKENASDWDQWIINIESHRDDMLDTIAFCIADELGELSEGQGEVAEVRESVNLINTGAIGVVVLIAFGFGYVTLRGINRPLQDLLSATRIFGEGDLDHRIPDQSLTEFQAIGRSFNDMAEKVNATQIDRDEAHRKLAESSRLAGMAEVATGVLHNVGNVLNNVNTSVNRMNKRIQGSKIEDLSAVSELLNEHATDFAAFVAEDNRGQQLPAFISQMSQHLDQTVCDLDEDLHGLLQNIDHIKQIVTVQQSYAKVKASSEACDLVDIIEDALEINGSALERHGITLHQDLADCPTIYTDRHKVLQILVNLISNAKNAMNTNEDGNRHMTISLQPDQDYVSIIVQDNGIGIDEENLTRVFEHGFTTRKDGHGFGLHTGALAAVEIGGRLVADSDGSDRGATFTLTLPLQTQNPEESDACIEV